MKTQLKVGDLVRVPGLTVVGYHGYRQGQVVEVVDVQDGELTTQGFNLTGLLLTQWFHQSAVRLAKQAMRKRDQYANRRG